MVWQDKNGQLYRKFEFKDFKQAFEFMAKIAEAAEAQNHHPRWLNEYNKVEIWLSTHEIRGLPTGRQGKITDKDNKLAKEVDRIYEDFKV